MGNCEEGKSCKPETSSSPAQDQTNIHMYPDWAAMQAYYGPRVAVPSYFNSAVASGHPHHPYMWAPPQPMMPPYGVPYAAIYAHGGVYAHPGVPHVATSLSMDAPGKSSGHTDQGLPKKLKGFDVLAMSIGNGSADGAEGGGDPRLSQSGQTEGSTSGSDGHSAVTGQKGKKRSHEEAPKTAGNSNTKRESSQDPTTEVNGPPEKVLGVTVASASAAQKVMGTILSPSMTTALELRNSSSATAKSSPTSVPQSAPMLHNEAWLQNERELKRERRKQSNRESARRSRLRKQVETKELARKVESLTAENMTLKIEIRRLTEDSEELKLENAKLMGKANNAQLGQAEEATLNKIDGKRGIPVGTENLLGRVNNSGSIGRNGEKSDTCENQNSGTKLHQLLDASRRSNTVVAG